MTNCFGKNINCCPFNITGHPAFSIPVGKVDDLPIGMMLVAKKFDEKTIYNAAFAWEQNNDWKNIN